MREPISLKDIFAIIIKRGKLLICLMVVFAVLLGGYHILSSRAPSGEENALAYQAQLESYLQTKEQLEEDLENAKLLYEQKKEYSKNSLVMQLEPYNLYKSISVFLVTVTETGDSKLAANPLENLAYIASVVQYCYHLYWNTTDLGVALDMDLENQYLHEVIHLEGSDSGALVLTVYGKTQEEAEALAEKASNCLLNMRDTVLAHTYPHEMTKFNQIVEHASNSTFADHQKEIRKQLGDCKENVQALEQQLNALVAPVQGSTSGFHLASAVKWAVVGAFAGLALGCIWILVLFVLFSRTESSQQMEATLGIPYLGTTAKPGDLFQRLAGKIMGEVQWKDGDQATAFVAENLRALGVQEDLAVITTLHTKDATNALERTVQALNPVCGNVRFAVNAQSNSNAIELLGNCKYLLMAERISVSDVPKMQALLSTAKRLGVTVLGFVTI